MPVNFCQRKIRSNEISPLCPRNGTGADAFEVRAQQRDGLTAFRLLPRRYGHGHGHGHGRHAIIGSAFTHFLDHQEKSVAPFPQFVSDGSDLETSFHNHPGVASREISVQRCRSQARLRR